MNYLKFLQQAGTMPINATYWHNKRYSPEDIKKIQVALNQHAIDGISPINVTGVFDKNTANAIIAFQQQHSGEGGLKVDGLAGDKTLANLGVVLNSGNALGATRKGANQSRLTHTSSNAAQAAEDAKMVQYFNSPEMIAYLTNGTNANVNDVEYTNLLYAALPYLSGQNASRVKYVAGIGDEYDEDVSRQHNAHVKREQGIGNLKSAVASNAIRSGENYEKDLTAYQSQYGLTGHEMTEAMEDPDYHKAAEFGRNKHEVGKYNSQKNQAERFQKDISKGVSDFGLKYVLPVVTTAGSMGLGAVAAGAAGAGSAVTSSLGAAAGGAGVNYATRELSNGQYNSWGDMMAQVTNTNPQNAWMWEFTNPGALAGGTMGAKLGSYNTGSLYKVSRSGKPTVIPGTDAGTDGIVIGTREVAPKQTFKWKVEVPNAKQTHGVKTIGTKTVTDLEPQNINIGGKKIPITNTLRDGEIPNYTKEVKIRQRYKLDKPKDLGTVKRDRRFATKALYSKQAAMPGVYIPEFHAEPVVGYVPTAPKYNYLDWTADTYGPHNTLTYLQ